MADICNVVVAALRKSGSSILGNRDVFLKCIKDGLGSDTREAKLLDIGCDDTFLGYFSSAMEAATKESLLQAAQEAAAHLTGTYVLDSEVSDEVTRGIATGCGTFLGIEMPAGAEAKRGNGGKGKKREAKMGIGMTIVTSAVVFALMSALAAAILSHFYPYLGCTVLPRKATVQGVECSWYVIKDGSGSPTQVVFLHNAQEKPQLVTANPGYGEIQSRALLRSGGDGLLILEGDNGTANITVTALKSESESSRTQFKLAWDYKVDENGDTVIEIQNDGERGLERCDVVLAQHGTFVNLRLVRGKKKLDQGVTEQRFGAMHQFSNFGDPLVIDDETELYVDGTKVPRL